MMAQQQNQVNKTAKILFSLLLLATIIVAIMAVTQLSKKHSSQSSKQPNKTVLEANDDDTSSTAPTVNPASQTVTPPIAQETAHAKCHVVNNSLPDPVCTPGAVDPNVAQDNIDQTICVAGYSKKVRPTTNITDAMKRISMQDYGFADSPSNYEYDHLISLELGGAPRDSKNLWPEPGKSPNPKDKIENKLHELVCAGKIPLTEAQTRISTNWTTALSGY